MNKKLGPTFGDEIASANLQEVPFYWDGDFNIVFNDDVSEADRTAVQAVVDAHDPTKQIVPEEVSRYQREVIMRRYGIYAAADALFMALPEDDERRVAWLTAPTTKRHSAATLYAVEQMHIPDAQADQMFIEAGQVE